VPEEKAAGSAGSDQARGGHNRASVRVERSGAVAVVTLDRPEVRNAIDGPAAARLAAAVREFEADDSARVAVLCGSGGNFCSGLDLKALASEPERAVRYDAEGDAPTGIARITSLSKPLIAAVEGYAVAAGLELALMCDLRVASEESVFGMFNRRWGVPLTDGGTFRLPRIVGQGRALDIILTGRAVRGPEALEIGLANRLVAPGEALESALDLAERIARFPQRGLRADRWAVLEQWSLGEEAALRNEWAHAHSVLEAGDIRAGAARFASGLGRHGDFGDI
jgi:enoyl-CoA hydratase